ncbi:MAG TPA: hypothetical protein QF695_08390, partial [Arenicellales bacterium]|nr:hypothetical protein [Arenicellales bacterium]
MLTVLSAAATGALLVGAGWTIDPPPPPPPQAARVKEAKLGKVSVLRFFLVDMLAKNSLIIEKRKVENNKNLLPFSESLIGNFCDRLQQIIEN